MDAVDPTLVAVPLSGLILVTLAVLTSVAYIERARERTALRVVELLCIYPGFAFVVFGVITFVRSTDGADPWVMISTGLLVEAVGIRLRAWLVQRDS